MNDAHSDREPIGSIPRPPELITAVREFQEGRLTEEKLNALYTDALRDTIRRLEATRSPAITDGEQTKPSFATYPIHGFGNLAPDGITVPFAVGISIPISLEGIELGEKVVRLHDRANAQIVLIGGVQHFPN